jgi:Rieske Fe-S protein
VGFEGVERVTETPLGKSWRSDAYLRFPNQGRFHPLKYIDGLARAIDRMKGHVYANSPVTEISDDAGSVTVKLANGITVSADTAIIATNAPIGDRLTTARLAPYRTYVLGGLVPKGAIPDFLYWDTEEPYHYVRLHPWGDHDLLLIGGEDHKSGEANDAPERFERLRKWGHERFPQLSSIDFRWSGQVLDTPDFAAFIGKLPGRERTFIAGGDSGQGITHGVVAGMLLTQLIIDRRGDWTDVYDPARVKPGPAASVISAVSGTVAGIAEHLSPGEISSAEDLKAGEGGIVRAGLSKVAACRDEGGALHRLSASCTHAGCIVHWNSFEQCWDCPCHGSQFAPDGQTLNGPAVEPLKPV